LQIRHAHIQDMSSGQCFHLYRSIFSSSSADFRERLVKLSDEELDYLVSLIFEGMESLHCVRKEHVDALVEVVGTRLSRVKATELLELYKFAGD